MTPFDQVRYRLLKSHNRVPKLNAEIAPNFCAVDHQRVAYMVVDILHIRGAREARQKAEGGADKAVREICLHTEAENIKKQTKSDNKEIESVCHAKAQV